MDTVTEHIKPDQVGRVLAWMTLKNRERIMGLRRIQANGKPERFDEALTHILDIYESVTHKKRG